MTQIVEIPQFVSLIDVGLGDDATFKCDVSEKELKFWRWYKQSLGHVPQSVANVVHGKVTLLGGFDSSRFTAKIEASKYVLTIRNVRKEDEAAYFCQDGTTYSDTFSNGTFLAVKGNVSLFCSKVSGTNQLN